MGWSIRRVELWDGALEGRVECWGWSIGRVEHWGWTIGRGSIWWVEHCWEGWSIGRVATTVILSYTYEQLCDRIFHKLITVYFSRNIVWVVAGGVHQS